MFVQDRIYGDFEIESPVLVELINSPAVQRLKGINQLGVPQEFYPFKSFSRFEHSLGVMLILKKLGATEEEQIAGLLHDASHTAFSHVIDWVVKEIGGDESYQDDNHLTILRKTELPGILEKYGYKLENITDYHRFGLLERSIPDLCADRVDYSLREFSPEVAKTCLEKIIVKDGFIVFSDVPIGKLFAINFLERQKLNWGGLIAVNSYYYFAKALRRALDLGCIKFEDFSKDDQYVLDLLKDCQDPEFLKLFSALKSMAWDKFPKSDRRMEKKIRYVDPLCNTEDGLKHLSELDQDFKQTLEQDLAEQKKGVPLVILE
ncbi:MAG: HD domain-containing protein [Patescibacteria group bacterium]|nr:HD domain-containing protein [Patescibacteria group bacterium]